MGCEIPASVSIVAAKLKICAVIFQASLILPPDVGSIPVLACSAKGVSHATSRFDGSRQIMDAGA
ncbi:MAG: hypothetical protein M3P45_04385 [Acidobacteriota bacterium]|nr:hypothetical protein [Acidobacteriota bacterium]